MKRFSNIIASIFLVFSLIVVANVFVNVYEDKNGNSDSDFDRNPKVKAAEITYEIADAPESSYVVPVQSTVSNSADDLWEGFLAWKDTEIGQVKKAEIIPDTYFQEDAQFLKRLNVSEDGLFEADVAIGGRLEVDGEATFEDKVTIENDEVEINGVSYYFPDEQASNDGYVLANDGEGNLIWTDVENVMPPPAVGVDSITGTSNQIIASASTGDVTLSIANTFVAPDSIQSLGNMTFGDAAGDSVTSNAGTWVFANASSFDLATSQTALNIENGLLNVDTTNSRIGIGTTAPGYLLDVAGDARFTGQVRMGSIPTVADNNLILTDSSGIVSAIDSSSWDKDDSDDFSGFAETDNRLARFDSTGTNIEDSSINDEYIGGVAVNIDSSGIVAFTNEVTAPSYNVGTNADANMISASSTGGSSTTLYIGNESILASGDIGSSVQAYDADLTTLGGLSSTDGNIIVGSPSGWVVESGNTARTNVTTR